MADPLKVIVEDDEDKVRVDPTTGSVETESPDGKVVVQFGAHDPFADDDEVDSDFYENLAEELDEAKLAEIAETLLEAIVADDASRQQHLANVAKGIDLLGLQLKDPKASVADASSSGVEGMSSVVNPLLLEAILKGWANAVGEFLPATGPVKAQNNARASAPIDDMAQTLEDGLNYWFTEVATEYYPDTSHMLLWGPFFEGSGFKKVYQCPMRRRPVSESVDQKDLIVSNTAKDLRSCGRITHQISMRPSVMKRMMLCEAYRDVDLTQPTPTQNQVDYKIAAVQGTQINRYRPEEQPYTVYESQCELDLEDHAPGKFKDKGIPLPYRVTVEKDSRKILAIRRDWNEDDDDCQRKRLYVRWPYVPGPGFYGTGLLQILGNATAAMTAAWREALDAGMYASFPGGMISKGAARQNSNIIRPSPGEFIPVETGGMRISDGVMPLPYRDVTNGLMTMIDKITAQSKTLGAATEIPIGEGLQDVPVGTIMAAVEQATKIMLATHKGMHVAQSEELKMVVACLREDPDAFVRAQENNENCQPDYWTTEKFLAALKQCQIVPQSDPNVPSHIHRLLKAVALAQLIMLPPYQPFLNPKEALTRTLRILREDETGLLQDPPPQQGQQDLAGQAKIMDAMTKQKKLGIEAQKQQATIAAKAAEMQMKHDIATIDLAKEMIIHRSDQARADQQQNFDQALGVAGQAMQGQKQMHDGGVAAASHGLERDRLAHDREMALREHAHDREMALREHGLEQQKHAHEVELAWRQHELDKKIADKPAPQPKGK